jgi:dTDP-4-dehydrorhamnose reductase
MDESTILILGGNGQLGIALQNKYPGARSLDITNTDSLKNFNWDNTKIILNAAAFTNVDGAETDEGRIAAWKVNAVAVGNVVNVALEHDLTLVHISTDYVFDGTKDPHTESESFSPLSVYGQTKAAGDITVGLAPKHYILRTSWVIGDGNNFVRTMLGLGQKGIDPKVVSDQIGRLTFTSELVRGIDFLLTNNTAYGTYNLSNSGDPASWADITRTIFNEAGLDNKVTDTSTKEYYEGKEYIANRPLLSTLDLTKIESLGFKTTDWHEDLKSYIKEEAS